MESELASFSSIISFETSDSVHSSNASAELRRGRPSMMAISPKNSPFFTRAMGCRLPSTSLNIPITPLFKI